jgi:hypothetical protein
VSRACRKHNPVSKDGEEEVGDRTGRNNRGALPDSFVVERLISIGFGKSLWQRRDRHGTEFVIALIPLGGYVKMLDERTQ